MFPVSQVKKVHPAKSSEIMSSKIYEIWKPIFIIFTIFGFNFLQTSRFLRVLINIYCVAIACSMTVFSVFYTKEITCSFILILLEYISSVIVTCVGIMCYGVNFFKSSNVIDKKLMVDENEYSKLKSTINYITFFIFVRNIVRVWHSCWFFMECTTLSVPSIIAYNFIVLAVDVNQLPRIAFFSLVHNRMKLLRTKIESSIRFNQQVKFVNGMKNSTAFYLDIYKNILDTVDGASKRINPMLMLNLLLCFPKVMVIVYHILTEFKDGDVSIFKVIFMVSETVQWATMPCIPAFFSELTSCEVDRIKIVLLNQYSECKNECDRQKFEEFLRYVELRPFKYRIWRLIPVNLTLPLGLLSLCTTYLIVIIQFTHLY